MRASVVSRRCRVTATSSAPWPLMVPAKTSSPGALVDRQRFAGDRRLVDVGAARDHCAVERNLLAGADDHDRADRDAIDRHELFVIAVPDARLDRREVHQGADGFARAIHAARFEPLRDGEQEHDGAASAHSPRNIAPTDRDEHEHVDVELADAERRERAARGKHAAGHDRRRRNAAMRQDSGAAGEADSAKPDAERDRRDETRARRARATRAAHDGSSCSSHARMPVSATASTIALVESSAASYFTCSRCPTMSAATSSIARQRPQAALQDGGFLAAAQPVDAEHRFGVHRAARAGRAPRRRPASLIARASAPARGRARAVSCTWRRPWRNSVMMWRSSSA